jgi:hypothetical protein
MIASCVAPTQIGSKALSLISVFKVPFLVRNLTRLSFIEGGGKQSEAQAFPYRTPLARSTFADCEGGAPLQRGSAFQS